MEKSQVEPQEVFKAHIRVEKEVDRWIFQKTFQNIVWI